MTSRRVCLVHLARNRLGCTRASKEQPIAASAPRDASSQWKNYRRPRCSAKICMMIHLSSPRPSGSGTAAISHSTSPPRPRLSTQPATAPQPCSIGLFLRDAPHPQNMSSPFCPNTTTHPPAQAPGQKPREQRRCSVSTSWMRQETPNRTARC